MKRALLVLLLAGLVSAAFAVFLTYRHAARQAAEQAALEKARAERASQLAQARRAAAPPEPNVTAAASTPSSPPMPPGPTIKSPSPTPASPSPRPRGKPALQDPLARVALSLVGADAEAEVVWVQAINNPDLPANERQDLIEDLNEEGFPDPKNITLDDLPFIVRRMEVIEAYAFDAMDEVNAAAFMEAYKDLVNMLARLTQR